MSASEGRSAATREVAGVRGENPYDHISDRGGPAPVMQSRIIQAQSGPDIGSQNQAPTAVIATDPTVPVQKNEVAALSFRAT